jgi:hypothetical protein
LVIHLVRRELLVLVQRQLDQEPHHWPRTSGSSNEPGMRLRSMYPPISSWSSLN